MILNKRNIAGRLIPEIGLGCMNLSHAYGYPLTETESERVVAEALSLGVTHFDSAALYGFGQNEILLGKLLKRHRNNIFLASKCGMTGVDGKRVIDGRPETLRLTLEKSLKNLQTDELDLYYLHRWDKSVPIEDSVGELSRMVQEGKIKAIGLSEVSSNTLIQAHKVHPIAALQTEYSLWTRNAEISVLNTCQKLEVAFVAFSPLGRGFLSGLVKEESMLAGDDIRKGMPRFQKPHLQNNLPLLDVLQVMSQELDCNMAQLSLAWLLHQAKHIHLIPGTTDVSHLRDNIQSCEISLTTAQLTKLSDMFTHNCISGKRYPSATQLEIDTEEY